jgi:CheY-like chemotaxis protein
MHSTPDLSEAETGVTTANVVRALPAGTRILIVDDDFESVTLLRAFLEDASLSLDFAGNGQEALERRRLTDPDLILMDMQMPIMDGYTATRQIRAWEEANSQRRVPIVALTAYALNGGHGNSIETGCDGHLTKPIQRDTLLDAIAEFGKPAGAVRPPSSEITLRTSSASSEGISASIRARRPAFLANRWRDLENLKSSLAALDYPAMRTIAHNCKGIGTGYGFPEISGLGLQISTAAKAFDTVKLHQCLSDFEACLKSASD